MSTTDPVYFIIIRLTFGMKVVTSSTSTVQYEIIVQKCRHVFKFNRLLSTSKINQLCMIGGIWHLYIYMPMYMMYMVYYHGSITYSQSTQSLSIVQEGPAQGRSIPQYK